MQHAEGTVLQQEVEEGQLGRNKQIVGRCPRSGSVQRGVWIAQLLLASQRSAVLWSFGTIGDATAGE
jgi:hypothetical protein